MLIQAPLRLLLLISCRSTQLLQWWWWPCCSSALCGGMWCFLPTLLTDLINILTVVGCYAHFRPVFTTSWLLCTVWGVIIRIPPYPSPIFHHSLALHWAFVVMYHTLGCVIVVIHLMAGITPAFHLLLCWFTYHMTNYASSCSSNCYLFYTKFGHNCFA